MYRLKSVTIRTNNTKEGLKCIDDVWKDILSGKLPLLFNSENKVSPISEYSNYENNENGDYDLTILTVTSDFFKEMDIKVSKGLYRKYDESDENGDISICTKKAWEKVWSEQNSGIIKRAFTKDYESTVPCEYTKDGKAHCYLYIAIK